MSIDCICGLSTFLTVFIVCKLLQRTGRGIYTDQPWSHGDYLLDLDTQDMENEDDDLS